MPKPPEKIFVRIPCRPELMTTLQIVSETLAYNVEEFAKQRYILKSMVVVKYMGCRHNILSYEIRKNDGIRT